MEDEDIQPGKRKRGEENSHQDMVDTRTIIPPTAKRGLRACVNCHLVKTGEQFQQYGCDNCPHLHLNETGEVEANTSTSFEGILCLANPTKSWVARYKGLRGKVPGVYAFIVYGQKLDEHVDDHVDDDMNDEEKDDSKEGNSSGGNIEEKEKEVDFSSTTSSKKKKKKSDDDEDEDDAEFDMGMLDEDI